MCNAGYHEWISFHYVVTYYVQVALFVCSTSYSLIVNRTLVTLVHIFMICEVYWNKQ